MSRDSQTDASRDGSGQLFADAAAALGEFRAKASARFVTIRRAHGVGGPLRVWACPVSGARGARPPACSRAVRLGAWATSARLRVPSVAGKVRVVVVRRAH